MTRSQSRRQPRHSAGFKPLRDVTLALGGPSSGRHSAGPAEPVDVSVAELLAPVVPDPSFPGFTTAGAR